MIALWVGIGLLCVVAILFVCWPLFRHRTQRDSLTTEDIADRQAENVRLFHEHIAELETQLADGRIDAAQFAQLKLEHERALLEDEAGMHKAQQSRSLKVGIKSFLLLGVIAIAVAGLLYQKLGSSADVAIQQAQISKQELDYADALQNRDPDPKRTRHLIALIEARLAKQPDQLQYWFILARSYMELRDFTKAANAYQQVLERDKQSGMVMAELAQALFLRDGNQMSPPIADLTTAALALEPENTMALGLAGINAFGAQDYPNAIKYWQRAVTLLGEDSADAQALVSGIERARAMYVTAGGNDTELGKAIDGRQITLSVSLGEGVVATPDQLVYVYARAWQGPKIPLAITRVKVSDLPAKVLLTEAMAMSPAMSLAQATQVELVARISQDGSANSKIGDWQGSMGPIDINALPADLHVNINKKITE